MTTYRKEMKGPSFAVPETVPETVPPKSEPKSDKKPPRPTTARDRLKLKLIEREKAKLESDPSQSGK